MSGCYTHTWRRENSQSTFIVSHSAPFRSSTVYQSSLHSSPFVLITQWFPGWGPLVGCKGTTDGPQKQQKVSLKFLRCMYFYKYIYLYKKWLKTGDKSLWVWDITHYFSLKSLLLYQSLCASGRWVTHASGMCDPLRRYIWLGSIWNL